MTKFKAFLKRKNIEISAKRYFVDALGAMAQGLFCSLLIGTILKTIGTQLGAPFIADIGTYAMAVSGPAMAVAIGYALKADPMVLFSFIIPCHYRPREILMQEPIERHLPAPEPCCIPQHLL